MDIGLVFRCVSFSSTNRSFLFAQSSSPYPNDNKPTWPKIDRRDSGQRHSVMLPQPMSSNQARRPSGRCLGQCIVHNSPVIIFHATPERVAYKWYQTLNPCEGKATRKITKKEKLKRTQKHMVDANGKTTDNDAYEPDAPRPKAVQTSTRPWTVFIVGSKI